MESQIGWMWAGIGIVFTACVSGFLFLVMRIIDLGKSLAKSKEGYGLKFSGLEKKIEIAVNLEIVISKIQVSLEKMEIALIGSYDNPDGLVQKHTNLEKRVEELEETAI